MTELTYTQDPIGAATIQRRATQGVTGSASSDIAPPYGAAKTTTDL